MAESVKHAHMPAQGQLHTGGDNSMNAQRGPNLRWTTPQGIQVLPDPAYTLPPIHDKRKERTIRERERERPRNPREGDGGRVRETRPYAGTGPISHRGRQQHEPTERPKSEMDDPPGSTGCGLTPLVLSPPFTTKEKERTIREREREAQKSEGGRWPSP